MKQFVVVEDQDAVWHVIFSTDHWTGNKKVMVKSLILSNYGYQIFPITSEWGIYFIKS